MGKVVVRNLSQVDVGQLLQCSHRLGALYSQLGHAVAGVLQLSTIGIVAHTPVPVLLNIGSIHHKQVLLRLVVIDNEVVHNPPLFVGETAVLCLPEGKGSHVVRRNFLQERQSVRTFHPELAHVRNVEYPHGVAHRHVFIDDARIFDRHVVSRKLVHLSTQRDMFLSKRSCLHFLSFV